MTRTKALLLLAVCALQAMDGFSTRMAIQHGALESNGLVVDLGLWPAKVLAIAIASFIAWRARNCRSLLAIVAFYSVVVLWNLHFSIPVVPMLAGVIVGAGFVVGFLASTEVGA